MKIHASIVLVLLLFLLQIETGCSVYTSAGRKQFEATTSGSTYRDVGIAAKVPNPPDEECWLQDANAPLQHLNPSMTYEVRPINQQLIEVCLENDAS